MWFQLASYGLYRLVGGAGSPTALFESVIRDPAPYWLALQVTPLATTVTGLSLLWRQTRGLSSVARSAALVSYFVAAASVLYGTWGFFNESFSFLLAVLFFSGAATLLRSELRHPLATAH